MLDEKTVQKLGQRLKNEEAKILGELAKFANKNAKDDFTARYIDLGDSEDDNVEEYRQYDFNLSLERKLEEELAAVRRALKKIEKGKYGICDNCKGEIKLKRLEAYPAASICMKCSADVGK